MATFQQHEQEDPAASRRSLWLRILAYAKPFAGLVLLALALSSVEGTSRMARAWLIKPILDEVALPAGSLMELDLGEEQVASIEAGIRENFTQIVIFGLFIAFVLPIASYGRQYVVAYSMGRIGMDMRQDACAKLLALPLRYHQKTRRGDVFQRSVGDVGRAHSMLSLLFDDVFQTLITITAGIGVLFFISWQMGLVLLLVGPPLFGILSLFTKRIRRSAGRRQQQSAEVNQRFLEILGGIKVIKAFRAESVEDAAFRRETQKLFRRGMKVVRERIAARGLVEFLNHSMSIGALGLGAWLMLGGRWDLSAGDIAAFGFVASESLRPMRKLAKAWVQIVDAQIGAERFLALMDTPIEVQDAPDAVAAGPVRQRVSFREVNFSYGREPVLHDVSFEMRAGAVTAVVGRTGAGKTTIADLLMRFYDPTSGSITVDGTDLRQISRDSLLGQIAVVSQEPFLFDGTIRDNIRYGRPDAAADEVISAARAAHVEEFVDELPGGYDTEVGPSGARLSGGQRQRITIARAILKDPSLLVLDEATSSLDARSEKYVQDAVDQLLGGDRTVFVIAHRLSTIRRADHIVVLEEGRIVASGDHDALMRREGLYRELIELQATEAPART